MPATAGRDHIGTFSPHLGCGRDPRRKSQYVMLDRFVMRLCALALTVSAVTACDRNPAIDAPPPPSSAFADSLPSMPLSLLEVPLTYDLAPVIAQLEKAVPRTFGDLSKRMPIPSNKRMHFAYSADREPFKVSFDGNTARIRSVIHYAGRGWYNPPLAPEIGASCGTSGERPRAVVEMSIDLALTQQWRLKGKSHVGNVIPFSDDKRDKCRITFLNMDVTGSVTEATRKQLQVQTRQVDAMIASLDVRSKFAEWWNVLSEPISLTDSVWLQINPIKVSKGTTRGRNTTLSATVVLTAAPEIITGPRPASAQHALPMLEATAAPGNGFHILIEGGLDYVLASHLMTEQLAGKRIQQGDRYLIVKSVRVFGIGSGKLALELRFGGTTSGHVFFVGTPQYSAVTDQLYVPDLDYDVASAGLLVRGLSWMKHDDIREFLRTKARWPVGGLLAQARASLLEGLNRELSPGVRLKGSVTHVEALGVHAGVKSVVVRAHADGSVALEIKQRTN